MSKRKQIKTVAEFFQDTEDREEIIFLGSKRGHSFVFCGSANEWDEYSEKLTAAHIKRLEDSVEAAKKALERATKKLQNFRPFNERAIKEDYRTTTGRHCLIFDGEDAGDFWKRDEFETYMDTNNFPKEKGDNNVY